MQKVKITIISVLALLGVVTLSVPAYADNPADVIKGGVKDIDDGGGDIKLEEAIKTIVNVMLFILGAIAVIMIIIGGIRYATSNGDSAQVKTAKDIVLYAVIGLVVAILSYAIVNFVLDSFS